MRKLRSAVLFGVRAQRRAVGGDVVRDELAEERPAGGDGRVVGARRLGVGAVAGAAGRADHVQQPLVGRERRQVGEHPPVAPAVDRRVDDPVRRQAVVAREHRFRLNRRHRQQPNPPSADFALSGFSFYTRGDQGERSEGKWVRNKLAWTFGITTIALFMTALDNLVVVTALPQIQKDLGASLTQLEWLVNAYTLTFAVLLLTGAALGDRFGRKLMFIDRHVDLHGGLGARGALDRHRRC